ncbi:protein-L-isoaspartate O-methyltransferase [Altererythrobacter sp. HHU K3-1]|uniref:Protein-L-isoaspartate O-methyltransferase n=2 Tax=Qipengyuania atrilutea TaxID=2744473 RepID=A0A850H1S2_9SPHN|nr:protein-L-isoaspartate O-methyltransferase [Actirhodobacter atriluteus]
MIDSQLRTSGVNADFVLNRMRSVAREDFVPEGLRASAYVDRSLKFPDGGVMAPPVFYGMMLEEARPTASDHVLIVDGGSGYLGALATPLAGSVTTVTPADAFKEANGDTPFTLVLIDGAIEEMPAALVRRMADDARVVTGLVRDGVTRIARGRKSGDGVAFAPLGELGIPRLTQFDRKKAWQF